MAINISVNGESIDYPQAGDPGWADNATNFAIQTSSALGQLSLDIGTTVDIPGTLDVTGNTTLDANLSVGGNVSVTGNATITGNLTANGNSNLGNASGDTITVTGILNVDSGVLYVDPTNNRVGINDTTPSQALDVTGNVAITGDETVGGTLNVTGATSLSSTLGVTGNSTLTGNLSVNGNTTLGDASGDSLTINSNGVSIPNGLNFDSDTFVIDATNNRVGIGVASPTNKLNIGGETTQFPTSVLINETGHATSKRAGMQIGSWLLNQDTLGNGTRDLGLYYTQGTPYTPLSINTNGQLNAVVPGGSTLYPGYLCRAWVNFNGTTASPSTIRGSGNVSSVTKNSTGNYTVNFINAMPDTYYLANVTADFTIVGSSDSRTTTTVSVNSCICTTGVRYDPTIVNVSVFR